MTGSNLAKHAAIERAARPAAAVVALLAPAGFGKSAVLEAAARAADGPTLHLSGGQGRAVVEALRDGLESGALVLLDDLDRLDDGALPSLASVIEQHAPHGGRTVLASRTRPNLPLRRWQVAGRADLVDASGLTLNGAEIQALLSLPLHEIDRVVDATRGWPSAVALLSQHLRRQPLDAALVSSREDHIAFVADEALSVLFDDERALLRRLAVLDRLDPPAVAAVAGEPRAPGQLRSIAQRTCLLDVRSGAVAWYANVREALLRELESSDPALVPSLHRSAAEALAVDHRQVTTRLQHLVRARAWEEAQAVVLHNWQQLLDADKFDLLVEAIHSMPPELVRGDPVRCLAVGAILLVWGHAATASPFLDAECVRSDPRARATAAAIRAHATWWSTTPDHAIEHVGRATALLARDPAGDLMSIPGFETITTGRSMLQVSRARALALNGQVGEAAELLSGLPDIPLDDPVSDSVSAWATKGWIDALAGHLVAATAATDMAFTLADAGGWERTPSLAPAHLARALVAARSGRDVTPWPDVDEAAEIAVRARAWRLLHTTRAVAAICGDVDHALPARDEAVPVIAPLAHDVVTAWRARDALRRGDLFEATGLLALVQPSEPVLGPWTEVALAVHGHRFASAALAALPPAASTPVGQISLVLAKAALTSSDADRAEMACAGLALARTTGLIGVLVDAPAMAWEALLDIDDPTVSSLVDRAVRPPPTPPAELSEREHEILRLLDGPLSLTDIGSEVYLSGHTAKWYAGRIYRKLGVHSRIEAVDRARELGLL